MEEKKEPLSRRDFLRRAGKEAVETGTRLVPGAGIARTVLGDGDSTPLELEGEPSPRKPGLLRLLARWRGQRQEGQRNT